jgi:hypothetical protein
MAAAQLEIYVEPGCRICARAEDIAAELRETSLDLHVTVIDLSGPGGAHRHLVVAAPTYVLNGRVISLGNPDRAELAREIALATMGADA